MAAAPSWNPLNGHNSAIYERICTENKVPGQLLASELVSNKIQDGGGRHIENHIFGHNSAIFARIRTKFEI